MLIGRCRAWIEDDPQLRPRRGARRGGMRSAGKGDEDRWRAGLSGENSNVLGPKNPGFTVFWTAGRAIAHEAEKQGVGRGEQCARASGQELTLNRQGAQGAHCAVRLRGAHWSVRGHRRPALRSARAHLERAARGQTARQRAPAAAPAPGKRHDALKLSIRSACASPARRAHAFASPARPASRPASPLRA